MILVDAVCVALVFICLLVALVLIKVAVWLLLFIGTFLPESAEKDAEVVDFIDSQGRYRPSLHS